MQESFGPYWEKISSLLRAELGKSVHDRWFASATVDSLAADALYIRVPNAIHKFFIESNYLLPLQHAIEAVVGCKLEVRFIANDAVMNEKAEPAAKPAKGKKVAVAAAEADAADDDDLEDTCPVNAEDARRREIKKLAIASKMNRLYTFREFVVGAGNEFAHAAAQAVAAAPAMRYNPLFFYGGSGLGKTHLLQAIGLHVLSQDPKKKVIYVSSEEFTNDFIDAIQNGSLVKFRRRFRQADILLIDDIHFLAGKERSQEEFFHTFNTLFDGHKQIVLSSDKPPSEINQLEHRLVSRFEWGLTAEVQPPDVETRHAILRKKAEYMRLSISDGVLEFLAERIRSNVRRLEGALNRVASYASLSQRPLGSEEVEGLLKDFLQEEAGKNVSIDQIQRRVAKHFDVRLADMTSKRRPANIAFPRQVAMFLSRELTNASLVEIGEAFGGRDHGTVLHACKTVKSRVKEQEKTRQVVTFLSDQLRMGL
jgi:chromosomal replication initiator protein